MSGKGSSSFAWIVHCFFFLFFCFYRSPSLPFVFSLFVFKGRKKNKFLFLKEEKKTNFCFCVKTKKECIPSLSHKTPLPN